METAGSAFRAVVERLPIEMPHFPILANATGQPIASLNDLRHLSQRNSQIFLLASFQLSLFAGDYR